MDPRAQYALNVLLDTQAAAEVPIVYADPPPEADAAAAIHVVPSGFFGDGYGTAASLPPLPLEQVEGVPLLFGRPQVVRRGSRLVVHADIVASAYFLLTRYEEWVRRDVRDEHGRFPGTESLPYRGGFIERPIVEEYSALLRKWAGQVGIHLPTPKRRFSVLLTHDVDYVGVKRRLTQPLRSLASGMVGRRTWKAALYTAAAALRLIHDPLDNFAELIQLDSQFTGRHDRDRCRLIYFFAGSAGWRAKAAYDIRSPQARRAVNRVLASGAEVGLHASYAAGQRPELLAAERALLEEVLQAPVRMNRHHYLAWREPEDGRELAAAGITWDSTLGYADVAGFRLGVCHPVPLFDPIRRQPLGIEEHPLIVMECSLSDVPKMNLDEEAAFDCVRRLAEATLRHQGEFVVLWHNHVLASMDDSYHRRLYPRVLDYLDGLLRTDEGKTV